MTVHLDRSLRLPPSEYFPEPQEKTGIAIHHTVCANARTTVEIWRRDKARDGTTSHVATAYVIDRDGTIYELFDPACWAWQFGLSWPEEQRVSFEKRFIGIEITSEGALMEHEGRLYAYDQVSPLMEKLPSESFDCGTDYRGYRWFDCYETEQVEALSHLVDDLCRRFPIPRVYPEKPFLYYGDALASFEGVIGHAMVRAEKSDPAPDPVLWSTLEEIAGLKPVPISPSERATASPLSLSKDEIDVLFKRNVFRINMMAPAAGSMVKALVMELHRRSVWLRLEDPISGDHAIGYEMVRGDRGKVAAVAGALGFKSVTDRVLEVGDE